MTRWAVNLKRTLAAAALFCLCSTVLAAPENPPSAPAERLYSVAGLNRLGAGVHWVEAYIAAQYYPSFCADGGRCPPPFHALIADAPGARVCADEKVCFLASASPIGKSAYYRARYREAAPGQTDSGDAFRVLENWHGLLNDQDAPLRLRVRVPDDPGKFALLEDFCAGADCEKRLYSLGEFNRMDALGGYWVAAYLVALRMPKCKRGSDCHEEFSLLSDAPRAPCGNGKIDALMDALDKEQAHVETALDELNNACSAHAFRLLAIVPFTPVEKKLRQEPENRRNGRLHVRIRLLHAQRGDADGFPPFAILEDFCVEADCEKPQGKED
ncbi:MAG: hypothetical protein LBU11_03025 [Zoogloeaceae bacterium]|jgi:hypothetical protein|nr:hypothetical protein [Zoogloeaceae bacterium]